MVIVGYGLVIIGRRGWEVVGSNTLSAYGDRQLLGSWKVFVESWWLWDAVDQVIQTKEIAENLITGTKASSTIKRIFVGLP